MNETYVTLDVTMFAQVPRQTGIAVYGTIEGDPSGHIYVVHIPAKDAIDLDYKKTARLEHVQVEVPRASLVRVITQERVA